MVLKLERKLIYPTYNLSIFESTITNYFIHTFDLSRQIYGLMYELYPYAIFEFCLVSKKSNSDLNRICLNDAIYAHMSRLWLPKNNEYI